MKQQLKEERKKIKQEVSHLEILKCFLKNWRGHHDIYFFFQARERYKKSLSHQIVPELEQLLSEKEYNLEGHTVSILELNVADLAEGGKWIGANKFAEEKEEQDDKSDQYDNDEDDNEIEGMSLHEKSKEKVQEKSKSDNQNVKSAKELKQEVKKAALKRVKKSKAFQQKQRLERQKNKKQSRQKLHKVQKLTQKHGKKNKKKSGR